MKIISKLIAGTTCLTIFSGTAYWTAITLAPPPNYTVSNADRLRSYDNLSVGNVYEKKTRSQEFYLGLSRWRRKMLKDERILEGRVLEIGAGCGGNLAYYPQVYLTDDGDAQRLLGSLESSSSQAQGGDVTSFVVHHLKDANSCDEIVLCDRSAGMVESCVLKIQSRLGYTPYRYPDYNSEGIRAFIQTRGTSNARQDSAPTVRRKIVGEDGTFQEVLATPLQPDDVSSFVGGEDVVPILQDVSPGDGLPLLSKEGERDLRQRQVYIEHRQAYRRRVVQALLEKEKVPSIPDLLVDKKTGKIAPQPLFSVANYAAEQLPFPDNSFDTVVDMFGLCSFDDPVRALREMSRVCRPGGKLLLIEHGRGCTPRVNNHLDKWAPRHAKNWGCWWNRDIRRIIRLSGLSVEQWSNKHFGTSHYIIAKPFKTMDEREAFHATLGAEKKVGR